MSQSRAIRSAFSEVFHEPVVYLAELAWRSVLTAAVTLLSAYAAIAYLHTLEVTDLDLWGLSGIVPGTAGAAWEHIFQGSGSALTRAGVAAVCGAVLLWWAAATLGRSATLATLVRGEHPALGTIARLNVLRCMVTTCGLIAVVGAYTFAFSRAHTSASEHDRGPIYAIFLPVLLLVGWAWSTVSWYLKVAQIPAAKHNSGMLLALQSAVATVRRHGSQFVWIGFVTGLLRAAAFMVAIFSALIVLSLALQSPAALGWTIMALYALLCLIVFTFLQVLQLAAYARVFAWANPSPGLD